MQIMQNRSTLHLTRQSRMWPLHLPRTEYRISNRIISILSTFHSGNLPQKQPNSLAFLLCIQLMDESTLTLRPPWSLAQAELRPQFNTRLPSPHPISPTRDLIRPHERRVHWPAEKARASKRGGENGSLQPQRLYLRGGQTCTVPAYYILTSVQPLSSLSSTLECHSVTPAPPRHES
jgi:hypothetical protein